jgi:hypothetical protein
MVVVVVDQQDEDLTLLLRSTAYSITSRTCTTGTTEAPLSSYILKATQIPVENQQDKNMLHYSAHEEEEQVQQQEGQPANENSNEDPRAPHETVNVVIMAPFLVSPSNLGVSSSSRPAPSLMLSSTAIQQQEEEQEGENFNSQEKHEQEIQDLCFQRHQQPREQSQRDRMILLPAPSCVLFGEKIQQEEEAQRIEKLVDIIDSVLDIVYCEEDDDDIFLGSFDDVWAHLRQMEEDVPPQ